MARRGEALWLAPHTMRRNTASAPFRPSRRASRGARTVKFRPRCGSPCHVEARRPDRAPRGVKFPPRRGSPCHGRNGISARKLRGAGRTRLVQRLPSRQCAPSLRPRRPSASMHPGRGECHAAHSAVRLGWQAAACARRPCATPGRRPRPRRRHAWLRRGRSGHP